MNFIEDVINESQIQPVLVDFWADWCAPCRFLGPVLEELANEAGDKWKLVKINTEEHPDLSTKYQIRSIPAVKLFSKGEVIAEFAGALPKYAIQEWLQENLPVESDLEFKELLHSLENDEPESQIESLKLFAAKYPDHKESSLLLAQRIVFSDPESAVDLVKAFHLGDPHYESAHDIRVLHEFLSEDFEGPTKVQQILKQAQLELRNHHFEASIEQIIQAVMHDKAFSNDLPRRVAIAFFRIQGNKHELTRKYRRKFDMALY